MSLKELTAAKHREAEKSPFMQAVFAGKMPFQVWADYTFNKYCFYNALETRAAVEFDMFNGMLGLVRSFALWLDSCKMTNAKHFLKKSTEEYIDYINTLGERQLLAHIYVWHMGDLYGGQMIKKLLPEASHMNLEFDDPEYLRSALRAKLSDDLADEANIAFDWAIRIMNEYTEQLS